MAQIPWLIWFDWIGAASVGDDPRLHLGDGGEEARGLGPSSWAEDARPLAGTLGQTKRAEEVAKVAANHLQMDTIPRTRVTTSHLGRGRPMYPIRTRKAHRRCHG